MATFIETVTVTEDVEYTTPVYRKVNGVFLKIYAADRMISVDPSETAMSITDLPYPYANGNILSVAGSTEESTFEEFQTAYETVVTYLESI